MYLTREEEEMLQGIRGEAVRLAAEVVVKVGEALGADRLVKVKSAHISGISFKNIGDEGLEFLLELKERGGKFSVHTTINPSGMDTTRWKDMGVSEEFAKKQLEVIGILRDMGAVPLLTCTPYLYSNVGLGDHLAWAESNAVLYANSIIGARTNREGGPLAVFEAIMGRAPYMGLHTDEGRRPTVIVDLSEVGCLIRREHLVAEAGYLIGRTVKEGVPLIVNTPKILHQRDRVKIFLAAIGASSSIGMVLLEGISPEFRRRYRDIANQQLERIRITPEELAEVRGNLSTLEDEEAADAVVLGCPHLSAEDVKRVFQRVCGKNPGKRLILFTARSATLDESLVNHLRAMDNVEIFRDTCMVVADLEKLGVKRCVVDSAKAAYYLMSQGYSVKLLSTEEALDYALR